MWGNAKIFDMIDLTKLQPNDSIKIYGQWATIAGLEKVDGIVDKIHLTHPIVVSGVEYTRDWIYPFEPVSEIRLHGYIR